MLPPVAERQAELARRFPAWKQWTLDAMLDAAAAEFPDAPFVVTDARGWTYSEIAEWSRRLARGLSERGIGAGDHVAIVLANYPEFVALKFAVSRIGAVAVPVNVQNRRDELGYILRQSDAAALIVMDRFRDLDYLAMLDDLAPGWETAGGGTAFPRLRQVVVFPTGDAPLRAAAQTFAALNVDGGWARPSGDPQALSDIIYTSGTTGPPKGVLLSHDQLLRAAFASTHARAFEAGQRIVFALPMYHVYGYVEGLLAVLFVGGAIVPLLKFDAAAMLDAVARHRATDVLLVPTMTLALLDVPDTGRDLSSLRFMLSSGGRAPARIWASIASRFGAPEVTTGYGMTETTASTTMTRPDDPVERLLTTNGRQRDAGIAGDPAIDRRLVAYRAVNDGFEAPPGVAGELMAKGLGVTRGYYNKPEATAEAFDAEGWLHTGDLGTIDADGYVTLSGRSKECYRCGGELVVPSEVEAVLSALPDVLQAHVVPVPDTRMGEVGVAFVVLRGGSAVTAQALIGLAAAKVARFKVPRHVLLVDEAEIPTTASGRARKFLLTERAVQALGLL